MVKRCALLCTLGPKAEGVQGRLSLLPDVDLEVNVQSSARHLSVA